MQPVAPIILLKSFFCLQHIRCKIVSAMQPVTLTIVLKQEQMRHGPRDKNTWARVTGQEEKCCLIHLLPLSNPSWGSLDMPIAHLPNSTLFMNFPQKSIFSNWKVLTLLRPSRPSSFSPPFPDTELAPARRALLRSQTFHPENLFRPVRVPYNLRSAFPSEQ